MTELADEPMGVDDFLRWAQAQETPYELEGGRPRAMTGGTRAHHDIAGSVFVALRRALAGRPCRARMEFAVATPAGNVRYPDVMVDCGPTGRDDRIAAAPTVVVEVTGREALVELPEIGIRLTLAEAYEGADPPY